MLSPGIYEQQIIYSFRKLYESICSVKDTFNDLSEAIEYIESQVVVETKSKKSKRIAEFFRIRSMYVHNHDSKFW